MNYVTHMIKIKSVCPVDPSVVDEYEVAIDVPRGTLVYAETITRAVDLLTANPITQEHLTQALADCLRCRVTSDGQHAGGRVKTTCSFEPQGPAVVKPEDIKL